MACPPRKYDDKRLRSPFKSSALIKMGSNSGTPLNTAAHLQTFAHASNAASYNMPQGDEVEVQDIIKGKILKPINLSGNDSNI